MDMSELRANEHENISVEIISGEQCRQKGWKKLTEPPWLIR